MDDRANPNLFVRSSGKEIWQRIATKTHPLEGALVTGSPGIGKSRSLTYLLKLLLENRQTVIFECRKAEKVFLFTVGQDGQYIVQSEATSGAWAEDINSIRCDINNWHLVDAGEARGPVQAGARIVLAAGPNRRHYHQFVKSNGTLSYYMTHI